VSGWPQPFGHHEIAAPFVITAHAAEAALQARQRERSQRSDPPLHSELTAPSFCHFEDWFPLWGRAEARVRVFRDRRAETDLDAAADREVDRCYGDEPPSWSAKNFGRTSAPHLPQAVQSKPGSDSRM
jgi:hypothetical protein